MRAGMIEALRFALGVSRRVEAQSANGAMKLEASAQSSGLIAPLADRPSGSTGLRPSLLSGFSIQDPAE